MSLDGTTESGTTGDYPLVASVGSEVEIVCPPIDPQVRLLLKRLGMRLLSDQVATKSMKTRILYPGGVCETTLDRVTLGEFDRSIVERFRILVDSRVSFVSDHFFGSLLLATSKLRNKEIDFLTVCPSKLSLPECFPSISFSLQKSGDFCILVSEPSKDNILQRTCSSLIQWASCHSFGIDIPKVKVSRIPHSELMKLIVGVSIVSAHIKTDSLFLYLSNAIGGIGEDALSDFLKIPVDVKSIQKFKEYQQFFVNQTVWLHSQIQIGRAHV
jgi:hypothetical protein